MVNFNPNIKTINKTLLSVIKQNKRNTSRLKPQYDEFISSAAPEKHLKNKYFNSPDYIKPEVGIKEFAKYGFKSADDFKLLSRFCMEKGFVCLPALALVLNTCNFFMEGTNTDIGYQCSIGEINFINYTDSIKTGKKFDKDKMALAGKFKIPFDYIKLQLYIDEFEISKKDYPIIYKALDSNTDLHFILAGLEELNKNKKSYDNLLKMIKLKNTLTETIPDYPYIDFAALHCYETPEAAISFYTPQVVALLDKINRTLFYPNSVNTAIKVKEGLFEISNKYNKIKNKNDITYFFITTEKDNKNHYLQGVLESKTNNNVLVSTYEYSPEGKLLSISEMQGSKDLKNTTNYFKDNITKTEIHRKITDITHYSDFIKEQKIERKTPDGKLIRTEYYKLSQLPGFYDVFYSYPDGRIETVSRGFENPLTGEQVKKARLVSAGNIVSNIYYHKDKNGSSYKYDITAPDGQKLMSREILTGLIDNNNIL